MRVGGQNHERNSDEAVWRASRGKRARQDDRLGEAHAMERRWAQGVGAGPFSLLIATCVFGRGLPVRKRACLGFLAFAPVWKHVAVARDKHRCPFSSLRSSNSTHLYL